MSWLSPRMRRPCLGPLGHLGGVGAEEERRHGQHAVNPDAVVQGHVMALHAPAPRLGIVDRVAEYGPGVQQGVADEGNAAAFLFQRAEDGFMVDDQLRLAVGIFGEPGSHECVGQLALLFVHVAEQQAVAVHRRVVPENPLAVVVVEADGRLLAGVESVQQRKGRAAHFGCGLRVGVRMVMRICRGHLSVPPWGIGKGILKTGDSVCVTARECQTRRGVGLRYERRPRCDRRRCSGRGFPDRASRISASDGSGFAVQQSAG